MALLVFLTRFVLSLATLFVLMILLFYHFKDRLSNIEKKCETLFHISQNLADQMSNHVIGGTQLPTNNKIIEVNDNVLKIPHEELETIEFNENIQNDYHSLHEHQPEESDDASDTEESDEESGEEMKKAVKKAVKKATMKKTLNHM